MSTTPSSSSGDGKGRRGSRKDASASGNADTMSERYKRRECPYVEGFVVNGLYGNINYQLSGPFYGPLVVCLHGMNASIGQFDRLAERLIRYRFRVLRFDFWGHGLSGRPKMKNSYTPKMFVEQLVEILHRLQLHEMTISFVGFSMGALVAVYAANDSRILVNRVVLISAAGLINDKPKRINACLSVTGCFTIPLVKASFLKCYVKRKHMEDGFYNPENFSIEIDERYQRFRYNHRRNIETSLRVAKGMPFWEHYEPYRLLAMAQKPVCLIYGDDDDITPHKEFGGFLRETFGPSALLIYRECKHLVLAEQFESAADDILYFLLGGRPGARRPSRVSVASLQQPLPIPSQQLSPLKSSGPPDSSMFQPSPVSTHYQPEERDLAFSIGTAGNKLVLKDGSHPAYGEGYGSSRRSGH